MTKMTPRVADYRPSHPFGPSAAEIDRYTVESMEEIGFLSNELVQDAVIR